MSACDLPTVLTPSSSHVHTRSQADEQLNTQILSTSEAIPAPKNPPVSAEYPRVRGYEVLSLIGTGGMGVVYKARQLELQRIVALKMLHEATFADTESRERFQAEAEAVARIQHPNIIQVFEIGTVQSQPGELHPRRYIALEFIDGGSLARHIESPLTPRAAARLVEKLARGVHAAHRLGVVHRDLKPANVLLTGDGEPKLADFGIAKQIGTPGDKSNRCLTQVGVAVGTPEYMAPEQVAGETPTPAVDIHALGVILYQLLTARLPFQGSTPADTMYLVRHQEPVSPRRLQPRLPRDLETICLKCLAKSANRRYESAEALAEDLSRWLDKRPILARPVSFLERSIRWARRNPSIAGLSIAVILVGLAGIAGVVWKWREAETHANAATELAVRERWERYLADIIAASSALQLHNTSAAQQALDAAPVEHRNWEWQYLSQQLDRSHFTFGSGGIPTHWSLISENAATALMLNDSDSARFWDLKRNEQVSVLADSSPMGRSALSPHGDLLAYNPAPPDDNTIVLHDIHRARTRAVLVGHEKHVNSSCFTRDGKRIATASVDGTVRIWDVETGKQLQLLQAHHTPLGICSFSSDGRLLATTGSTDRTACVWDLDTKKKLLTLAGHSWNVDSCAFNRSGDRIVTAAWFPSNTLWLWEYPSGKLLAELSGHKNQILSFAFSPDGNRLVTVSRDQSIRLWDGRSGRLVSKMLGHRGGVNDVAFSPDSTRLVTASQDRTLRLWDAANGIPLAVMSGHFGEVFKVAYTPDGSTIVSASRDSTIKLWDARTVEFGRSLRGHTNFVYGVAFHPDGQRVATASWDGSVRVWDAIAHRQLLQFDCGEKTIVSSVAFHPDGKWLASLGRDNAVRLWDLDSGKQAHRWELPSNHWQDSRIAISPRGDLLAAADRNKVIHLWNVWTKEEVARLEGHRDTIRDLAFSSDGHWLASGSEFQDTTIRIWNVDKLKCERVLEGHTERVYAVAFNRDGTLLTSGSTDGTVRLWDTSTWEVKAQMNPGTNVYCVAFSPDGGRLAVGCADNSIRFYNVATTQEVVELRGHSDYVHSIAFSPDGSRLVSGSGDFTARIWDSGSGRQLGR